MIFWLIQLPLSLQYIYTQVHAFCKSLQIMWPSCGLKLASRTQNGGTPTNKLHSSTSQKNVILILMFLSYFCLPHTMLLKFSMPFYYLKIKLYVLCIIIALDVTKHHHKQKKLHEERKLTGKAKIYLLNTVTNATYEDMT